MVGKRARSTRQVPHPTFRKTLKALCELIALHAEGPEGRVAPIVLADMDIFIREENRIQKIVQRALGKVRSCVRCAADPATGDTVFLDA